MAHRVRFTWHKSDTDGKRVYEVWSTQDNRLIYQGRAFANIRAQFGAQFDAIDPDAADRRDPTWYAASDTATVRVVAAGDLRTVPMPDLRSPYGIPTSTDRIDALTAQVDALREQQAAITAELHRISEQLAERPLAMAEDAWGCGG